MNKIRQVWNSGKQFIFPLLLIGLIITALVLTVHDQAQATQQGVYGLVFGVALGFSVDILKRSVDEARRAKNIKKTAKRILEQDAKSIYRTVWLYTSLLKSDKIPEAMKIEVKKQIPPEFKLRYWSKIKDETAFLLLASDDFFHEVYSHFFDIEEINDQIQQAENGDVTSHQFAIGFYQVFIDSESHKELLKCFVGEKGVKEFEQSLLAKRKTGEGSTTS